MKKLNAILLAAGLGAALPAAAVSWTTTGSVSPGSGSTTGCSGGVACSLSFSSGTDLLAVRAYSTQNDDNLYDNNRATTSSRSQTWIQAQIALYGGGLGIRNLTNDYRENTDPEHAVDNDEVWDAMVFELPVGTWDMTSLSLGYRAGDTGSTDVDIWIGGAGLGAGYNFSGVCFEGCGTSLASLGFTQLPSLTFSSNGTQSVGGTATGRYIVVAAGAADHQWEAFKIKGIGADRTLPPPPVVVPPSTAVPEPGSLALLGLGLAGLAWRRRTAARS